MKRSIRKIGEGKDCLTFEFIKKNGNFSLRQSGKAIGIEGDSIEDLIKAFLIAKARNFEDFQPLKLMGSFGGGFLEIRYDSDKKIFYIKHKIKTRYIADEISIRESRIVPLIVALIEERLKSKAKIVFN